MKEEWCREMMGLTLTITRGIHARRRARSKAIRNIGPPGRGQWKGMNSISLHPSVGRNSQISTPANLRGHTSQLTSRRHPDGEREAQALCDRVAQASYLFIAFPLPFEHETRKIRTNGSASFYDVAWRWKVFQRLLPLLGRSFHWEGGMLAGS
jgi:hypothetical protein